jgi:NTE family protein
VTADGIMPSSPVLHPGTGFLKAANKTAVGAASLFGMAEALIPDRGSRATAQQWREFLEHGTPYSPLSWARNVRGQFARAERPRTAFNKLSALWGMTRGAPGFFTPRLPPPQWQPRGTVQATSYYDNGPLRQTLERLVDFDRINAGEMRFTVGAVNVRTGNLVAFTPATHRIRAEHIMASGAVPPALPPVEIEGEFYWDGGLVSNTPLRWVIESERRQDTLAFQVDLWNAVGEVPGSMGEVLNRMKEIFNSSRTRANSDRFRHSQEVRNALSTLMPDLPDEIKCRPEFEVLRRIAERRVYSLVQIIYRSRQYEGDAKDHDFSRLSMVEHWKAGYHDAVHTLRHPEIFERPKNVEGVFIFDLAQDGRT